MEVDSHPRIVYAVQFMIEIVANHMNMLREICVYLCLLASWPPLNQIRVQKCCLSPFLFLCLPFPFP